MYPGFVTGESVWRVLHASRRRTAAAVATAALAPTAPTAHTAGELAV